MRIRRRDRSEPTPQSRVAPIEIPEVPAPSPPDDQTSVPTSSLPADLPDLEGVPAVSFDPGPPLFDQALLPPDSSGEFVRPTVADVAPTVAQAAPAPATAAAPPPSQAMDPPPEPVYTPPEPLQVAPEPPRAVTPETIYSAPEPVREEPSFDPAPSLPPPPEP